MKKVLFLFLSLLTLAIDAKTAGNWYSDLDQVLYPDNAVTFNFENYSSDISLLNDRQSIQFKDAGYYSVRYTVVGSLVLNQVIFPGRWSVGVSINDIFVPGGVEALVTGPQFLNALLTLTGEVIVKVNSGDLLQLRNSTSGSVIQLLGSTSNDPNARNSSATVLIKKIN